MQARSNEAGLHQLCRSRQDFSHTFPAETADDLRIFCAEITGRRVACSNVSTIFAVVIFQCGPVSFVFVAGNIIVVFVFVVHTEVAVDVAVPPVYLP